MKKEEQTDVTHELRDPEVPAVRGSSSTSAPLPPTLNTPRAGS